MKGMIYTIGHSTRNIQDFISLLKESGIEMLVDIRTIPNSRYNPQFNSMDLKKTLENAGIKYQLNEKLGGLRHAKKDSINLAWRNLSFRGYADHMQTDNFEEGLGELIGISSLYTTVIMCAEAVPWRCHRSLVADALVHDGYEVFHIMGKGILKKHLMTNFSKTKGNKVYYPI